MIELSDRSRRRATGLGGIKPATGMVSALVIPAPHRDNHLTLALIAILLLDPPLKRVVSKAFRGVKDVDAIPYQGGYKDFIKYANLADACSTIGPSRESIIEDISYYWCTYGHRVEIGASPVITTFFLQKIVASHYMHYIEYFFSILAYLEWALSWQIDLITINTTLEWS